MNYRLLINKAKLTEADSWVVTVSESVRFSALEDTLSRRSLLMVLVVKPCSYFGLQIINPSFSLTGTFLVEYASILPRSLSTHQMHIRYLISNVFNNCNFLRSKINKIIRSFETLHKVVLFRSGLAGISESQAQICKLKSLRKI